MIILICKYHFVQVLTKSTCREGKVEFYSCFSFFVMTQISFLVFQAEAAVVCFSLWPVYRQQLGLRCLVCWACGRCQQGGGAAAAGCGAGRTGTVRWTLPSSLEQKSSQEKFPPKFRCLNFCILLNSNVTCKGQFIFCRACTSSLHPCKSHSEDDVAFLFTLLLKNQQLTLHFLHKRQHK